MNPALQFRFPKRVSKEICNVYMLVNFAKPMVQITNDNTTSQKGLKHTSTQWKISKNLQIKISQNLQTLKIQIMQTATAADMTLLHNFGKLKVSMQRNLMSAIVQNRF